MRAKSVYVDLSLDKYVGERRLVTVDWSASCKLSGVDLLAKTRRGRLNSVSGFSAHTKIGNFIIIVVIV